MLRLELEDIDASIAILPAYYDYELVAWSIVITVTGSDAAFDLAGRVTRRTGESGNLASYRKARSRLESARGGCTTSGCLRSVYRFRSSATGPRRSRPW